MARAKKVAPPVEKSKEEQLQEIGASAYSYIEEMVAALECDYDRLEELRDEREEWVENDGGDDDEQSRTLAGWMKEFPEEFAELAELESAAGDCESREEAEQRITEGPLSLEFRSGWVTNHDEMEPEEFCLLLSTGGPAVRIVGEIRDGQAHNPRLEVQDWFTPWTEFRGYSQATLETYCNCFYFGD
jgi:hypothetical protein